MFEAFSARQIVELKPKEKAKVEAILAFGDRLLLGLSTGGLRIYRIDEESSGGKAAKNASNEEYGSETPTSAVYKSQSVVLIRDLEKFSSRAVQQLAIIKEANILISLSDGSVFIHDLQDYTLLEQISRTKGATTFAVTSNIIKDVLSGIPSIVSRLAVVVKRKLLIWAWHDTELSVDVIEIGLASPVKQLTWASGTKIICGLGNGFVAVDINLKSVTDIVGPGSIGGTAGQEGARFGGVSSTGMGYIGMGSWAPKPLISRLTDGELLLAKDVNTLFVNSNGEALNNRQIPWSVAPDALAFSYPYILALQSGSKGNLEVRNPDTRSLLQTISLPNALQIHVPQPNVSLAHAGKGFLVASDKCVWRMSAKEYGAQIDQLVDRVQYDEAISLLGMLEEVLIGDKEGRLREVKMQKAHSLFNARKFRDALDLYTDVLAPPEKVVRLYPRSIAGVTSSSVPERPMAEAEDERDLSDCQPKEDDVPAEPRLESVRRSQATEQQSKKATSDTASILSAKGTSPVAVASEAASVSDRQSVHNIAQAEKALSGEDLHAAVSALCSFLADTRRRLQRYLNPDGSLKETLDSANASLDFLLLLSPPASSSDEIPQDQDILHQRLLTTARLVDTTLFRSYTLTRPSLASSLFRISNFCDAKVVNDALLASGRYAELVDFLHGKKLHRQALELLRRFGRGGDGGTPEGLAGSRRTVSYLQSLGRVDVELVMEFGEWVLLEGEAAEENSGEGGLEIFIADTENAEMLPRDRIAAFLKEVDGKLDGKPGLERRYLEHVIKEWDDLTPSFHTRLVTIYIEDLLQIEASDDGQMVVVANQRQAELIPFLKSSSHYSPAKALNLIPRDKLPFYEPRAIVLSKMGQHKQALEIYVFKLQDYTKAEEYCNHVYLTGPQPAPMPSTTSSTDSSPPSIYHTLLSLYLHPPPSFPVSPLLNPALILLSRHGPRLPPSSTLDLIPPSLPITDLLSYFRGRIRAGNSDLNSANLEMGLRSSERIRTRIALVLGDGKTQGRQRRVVVGEERVCGVCHRRLGGSAVAVMPDNTVVHYGCVGRGTLGSAKPSKREGILQ